jgi:hypothetical protein
VLIFVAGGVIAVFHLISLEKKLETLGPTVDAAEVAAENGHIQTALNDLQQLQAQLSSVNSTLYNSPDLEMIGLLPVAHQNLAAIRDATSLSLQMIGGGEQILHAAAPLESPSGHLDLSLHGGQIPLATSQAIASALSQVAAELPASSNPPSNAWLVGKVRRGVDKVYAQAAKRRSQLQSVGSAVTLLDDIAGVNGPRRYLIAVSNTAEMRGSGGMVLSYGVLQSAGGKVSLVHVGGIDELSLARPETTAPFPADFMSQFGNLEPTQQWRNENLMSDFTVDAPVMEAMYTQATGQAVNGVIEVDPEGLADILSAIGPVQTPDLGTVTSANVVPLSLNLAYTLFPDRPVRQDYTEEAAKATFTKLTNGDFTSLRPLGTELLSAGKERHLLLYTDDHTDEAISASFGMAGGLPPAATPFTQLTVQNVGANKLDYYLQTSLVLHGTPPSEVGSRLSATITITNTAPRGTATPSYIFGSAQPGAYNGLVTLYLPPGSGLLASHPDSSVTNGPAAITENGVRAIIFSVVVPAGGTSVVTLDLFAAPTPHKQSGYVYVPSPRVIPTTFTQQLSRSA